MRRIQVYPRTMLQPGAAGANPLDADTTFLDVVPAVWPASASWHADGFSIKLFKFSGLFQSLVYHTPVPKFNFTNRANATVNFRQFLPTYRGRNYLLVQHGFKLGTR